ncbi:MAG TPA: helix-turn-helix domain-containing protein [Bryobacteraceae bacterium]|nr:helix-turn-helix domain-containing protein [Bryobacteraceae bacterium]
MMELRAQPVQLKLELVLPLEETFDTFTAARVAKVTMKTIRDWCERGRVPACKPVGRWRVDKPGLYRLIAAGKNIKPLSS